ncbi:MAG: HPP family protein [Methylococcaceae bacterium]|nr:HPP family protein [Methylococcaceae bacterium]
MRFIPVDPVNLSIRGKLIAVASSFFAILIIAWVSQIFSSNPILIASMGASAVIVFIIPNSPLAQPWPLIGGQLISTLVGVTCAQLIPDTVFAAASAVGGSILAMFILRCLHPPGAASALTPIASGDPAASYSLSLMPVGLNVIVMLIMAIVIHRWVLRREYPILSGDLSAQYNKTEETSQPQKGISEQDLIQALQNMDIFMDISSGDLNRLLTDAQKRSFKRFSGNVICADIMDTDVSFAEYGTEVEAAWKLMQHKKLKALPVIDRARRIIGIITWHDFVKCISLRAEENIHDKLREFIRRTPDVSTKKPESVGHIMSSRVVVLTEVSHIVELIPLMSDQGYSQIPIVNAENRLVGMVYQANLIAALYDESDYYVKSDTSPV